MYNFIRKFFKYYKFLCKILTLPLLYILYFFSFFSKRDSNLWVFGSSNDNFNDNAKYLYLYINKHAKNTDIKAIWITSNKTVIKKLQKLDLPVARRWSLMGIFYTLRAGVYIYNSYLSDINFWTSGNCMKFNLWHGIPLKRIEHDVKVGKVGRRYKRMWKYIYQLFSPWLFSKPDYLLSTSHKVSEILSSAFKIHISNCLEFGYPRCDIFFYDLESLKINFVSIEPELVELLKKMKSFAKVIIYMPTFRESKNDPLKNLDFNSLNAFMKKHNYLLVIKPHPNIKLENEQVFENIVIVSSSLDIYPLLPFSDLLITDYSSVMFDYLLLNKKIILYLPDLRSYCENERGFYSLTSNIIDRFKKCFSFEELLNEIEEVFSEKDSLLYEDIIPILWNKFQGNSSKRIYAFLTQQNEEVNR